MTPGAAAAPPPSAPLLRAFLPPRPPLPFLSSSAGGRRAAAVCWLLSRLERLYTASTTGTAANLYSGDDEISSLSSISSSDARGSISDSLGSIYWLELTSSGLEDVQEFTLRYELFIAAA